jgi:hypothetical protein
MVSFERIDWLMMILEKTAESGLLWVAEKHQGEAATSLLTRVGMAKGGQQLVEVAAEADPCKLCSSQHWDREAGSRQSHWSLILD